MTSMVDEAIAWRRLRPLFEEEALGDHSAEAIAFDLLSGEQLVIRQEPRRAARLERAPAQHLGCATEAASATGATVWDSAHVVCRYLEARPSAVRGRRVVELGAGAGLVSCVAWRLGAASVVATERPEMLALLRANCEANCPSADGARRAVRVHAHMWGGEGADALAAGGVDTILAVDCVYDQGAVEPLMQSIAQLMRFSPRATALVAVDEQYRRPHAALLFMSLLAQYHLSAVPVSMEGLDSRHRRDSVSVWAVNRPGIK